MQKRILLSVLLVVLALSSCQVSTSTPPASSRNLYFSETHHLRSDIPHILSDMVVEEVYPGTFSDRVNGPTRMLLRCKIKHIFFIDPDYSHYEQLQAADAEIFLLIDLHDVSADLHEDWTDMAKLLQDADSIIVYGRDLTEYHSIPSDSFEAAKWKELGISTTI